jgi:hypothetical protein
LRIAIADCGLRIAIADSAGPRDNLSNNAPVAQLD